ncbi:MAG: hypothetical protein WBI14_00475 [Anaerolineaceae bacterium]
MKRFAYILLVMLVIIVFGCSINSEQATGSIAIKEQINLISKELIHLGEINIQWLSSRNGWIHIVSQPSEEGIMKFTFQERWTHYQQASTECIEEMRIIRRTENSEDGQFRIHTPEGYEGELIKLRHQIYFNDSIADNQIQKAKCLVSDRSSPISEMTTLIQNKEFVTAASLTEEMIDSLPVIVITIHYRGDNPDKLGIPENAIGKKETIYFDKDTGNRIRFELVLEFPNGDWEGKTSIEDKVTYLDSLPADVQQKLESAIKELNYYLE